MAALLLSPAGPVSAESPSELVRAALDSELAGPSQRRGQLLAEALRHDADFAPARWQSGYLKWDDRWLSVEEVTQLAQHDPLRSSYRRERVLQDRAAPNHRHLAKWCAQLGLAEEARLHWSKVLHLGDDDEAREALALVEHQGRLLTQEQIQQQQRNHAAQRRAAHSWTSIVVSWRDAILRGSRSEAAAARSELVELSDPGAIAPLRKFFLQPNKAGQLNRLFVETVGHLDGPPATEALLQVASWHPSRRLRDAALAELKKRPKYAVVPLLLAGLEYPVESSYRIHVALDGSVVRNHKVRLRGWLDDYYLQVQHKVRSRAGSFRASQASRLVNDLAREAQQTHEQIARRASLSPLIHARHQSLLAQVMDTDPVDDPGAWYRRWLRYREYDVPYYQPRRTYERRYQTVEYRSICFPADTMVATLLGQRPIETIRVGDRVLAQDVDTGQIAYKLVHKVTRGAPSPMIRIGLGTEPLRATRGHPFWVNGKTWLMAKELEVGMVLHGLLGAVVVESLEEASSKTTYNLVVGDYNTYFVGNQQLLVHDHMPPVEPSVRVPGYAFAREH